MDKNQEMARAWIERALADFRPSGTFVAGPDLREDIVTACTSALAAAVRAKGLLLADQLQSATDIKGQQTPRAATRREGLLAAAAWCRDHADDIPELPR